MTDQAEKKHSAFWGVMVIAGTVIGGGMFALPVDLAGAWFFWGAFILIIAWFSMLHSGLLLLEANLNYPVGSSFNTITKDLIGNTWNIISGITVAFVLYILTYAYISANGAIISETISMNLGYHANPRIVGICTAIFVASKLAPELLGAIAVAAYSYMALVPIVQPHYLIVPRAEDYLLCDRVWFFLLPGRLLHPARCHQHHCGNVLLPVYLYGFAGVSGVIWFPRQYSQPDYLLWKTQR